MLSQSGARYGETSPGFTWVCAHYLISLIISVADGSEGGIASHYGQNHPSNLYSVSGAPKPVDPVHRDMEQRPLEYVSFPVVPSILIFNWFFLLAVGSMVQQLASHTCEVGLNLVPWIWSRSSLAFHQSLLPLIPGGSTDLSKSTFKSPITDDLYGIVPCVPWKLLLPFSSSAGSHM